MGTFVWSYSPRTNSLHLTMNSFVVFTTLLAAACAAPQTVVNTVNEGPQTGPLTPLVGGLVQTPKGFRSIDLEGFSEDLNEDGFVDPVVPAVPAPIVAPAPIALLYNGAAPFYNGAAPVFNSVAPVFNGAAPVFNNAAPIFNGAAPVFNNAAPIFNPAPIASPVFSAPTTVVRTSVAPSPAVFRTISPLPAPVRAAPSAVVYDSRLHG